MARNNYTAAFLSLKGTPFYDVLDKETKQKVLAFEQLLQGGIDGLSDSTTQTPLDEIIILAEKNDFFKKAILLILSVDAESLIKLRQKSIRFWFREKLQSKARFEKDEKEFEGRTEQEIFVRQTLRDYFIKRLAPSTEQVSKETTPVSDKHRRLTETVQNRNQRVEQRKQTLQNRIEVQNKVLQPLYQRYYQLSFFEKTKVRYQRFKFFLQRVPLNLSYQFARLGKWLLRKEEVLVNTYAAIHALKSSGSTTSVSGTEPQSFRSFVEEKRHVGSEQKQTLLFGDHTRLSPQTVTAKEHSERSSSLAQMKFEQDAPEVHVESDMSVNTNTTTSVSTTVDSSEEDLIPVDKSVGARFMIHHLRERETIPDYRETKDVVAPLCTLELNPVTHEWKNYLGDQCTEDIYQVSGSGQRINVFNILSEMMKVRGLNAYLVEGAKISHGQDQPVQTLPPFLVLATSREELLKSLSGRKDLEVSASRISDKRPPFGDAIIKAAFTTSMIRIEQTLSHALYTFGYSPWLAEERKDALYGELFSTCDLNRETLTDSRLLPIKAKSYQKGEKQKNSSDALYLSLETATPESTVNANHTFSAHRKVKKPLLDVLFEELPKQLKKASIDSERKENPHLELLAAWALRLTGLSASELADKLERFPPKIMSRYSGKMESRNRGSWEQIFRIVQPDAKDTDVDDPRIPILNRGLLFPFKVNEKTDQERFFSAIAEQMLVNLWSLSNGTPEDKELAQVILDLSNTVQEFHPGIQSNLFDFLYTFFDATHMCFSLSEVASVDWYTPSVISDLKWLSSLSQLPNKNELYLTFQQLLLKHSQTKTRTELPNVLAKYRGFVSLGHPEYVNFLKNYLETLDSSKTFHFEHFGYFVRYLDYQTRQDNVLSDRHLSHIMNSIQSWVDKAVPPGSIHRYLKEMEQFHWTWHHPKQALTHYAINQAISGEPDGILFDPSAFKKKKFDQVKSQEYFAREPYITDYVDALFHRALAVPNPHPQCGISPEELSEWYEEIAKSTQSTDYGPNSINFADPDNRLMLAEILGTLRNNFRFLPMMHDILGGERVTELLAQGATITKDMIKEQLFLVFQDENRFKALHQICQSKHLQSAGLEELPFVRVVPTLLEMTIPERDLVDRTTKLINELKQEQSSQIGPFSKTQWLKDMEEFVKAYQWFEDSDTKAPKPLLATQFTSTAQLCRDYAMRFGKRLYTHLHFLGSAEEVIDETSPTPVQSLSDAKEDSLLTKIDAMVLPWLISEQHQALKRYETQGARLRGDKKEQQEQKISYLQKHVTSLVERYPLSPEQKRLSDSYQAMSKHLKTYLGSDHSQFKKHTRTLQDQYKKASTDDERKELIKQFLSLCAAWLYQNQQVLVRPTQLLEILDNLENTDRNQLLKMDTGEGKTVVQQLYALTKAFQGQNVDLYSHSIYMAQNEMYPKFRNLATGLGFSIGCPHVDGAAAYRNQIVVVNDKTHINHQMQAEFLGGGPLYLGTDPIEGVNVDEHGFRKKEALVIDEVDTVIDQLYSSVNVLSGAPYSPEVQSQFESYYKVSNLAMAIIKLREGREKGSEEEEMILYQTLIRAIIDLKSTVSDVHELVKALQDKHKLTFASNGPAVDRVEACIKSLSTVTDEQLKKANILFDKLCENPSRMLIDFQSASTVFSLQREVHYDRYEMTSAESGEGTKKTGKTFEINIIDQATSGERNRAAVWSHGVHQRVALMEQAFLNDPKDTVVVPGLKQQLAQKSFAESITEYRSCLGVTGTPGNEPQRQLLEEILTRDGNPPQVILMDRYTENRRYDHDVIVFDDQKKLHHELVDFILSRLSADPQPSLLFGFTTEKSVNAFLKHIAEDPIDSVRFKDIIPNLLNVTGEGSMDPLKVSMASRAGTVSFTTSAGGRGVDYDILKGAIPIYDDPKHPFDKRQRDQHAGRAGRAGQQGESWIFATKEAIHLPEPPSPYAGGKRSKQDIQSGQRVLEASEDKRSTHIAKRARKKLLDSRHVAQFKKVYLPLRQQLLKDPNKNQEKIKALQDLWISYLNDKILPLLKDTGLKQQEKEKQLAALLEQFNKESVLDTLLMRKILEQVKEVTDDEARVLLRKDLIKLIVERGPPDVEVTKEHHLNFDELFIMLDLIKNKQDEKDIGQFIADEKHKIKEHDPKIQEQIFLELRQYVYRLAVNSETHFHDFKSNFAKVVVVKGEPLVPDTLPRSNTNGSVRAQ